MRRGILQFGSQIALLMAAAAASAEGRLFDAHTVLEIELRGPLEATLDDTRRRDERPFVVVLGGREIGTNLRVRGNSRAEVCRFPPLRLSFAPGDAEGTAFEGLDAVKLVTHCRPGKSYSENVVEEFLAYRLFQLVSDKAFRVRLLRVHYVDTERPGREPVSRFAVAIEPEKDLAARLGGDVLETEYVKTKYLDRQQAAVLFVFQFLIGNTDWSLVRATGQKHCCHNVTLIDVAGRHVPVPYDFDQSGIVNAAYARPHPGLGLRTVRTRRYRGNCISGLDLDTAVQQVVAAEAAIRAQVASLPGATSKQAARRQAYLDEFFAKAVDPAGLAADFERRCVD